MKKSKFYKSSNYYIKFLKSNTSFYLQNFIYTIKEKNFFQKKQLTLESIFGILEVPKQKRENNT
jgi:hypothetical protein